ncbi:MAG TPA: hypothetical protein VKZ50_05985 [bacterium]|nr:hypothetical protein [bacterium]
MEPRDAGGRYPPGGAWLGDPGPVTLGSTFRTMFWLAMAAVVPGRSVTADIVFDPRMVYCVAVEPAPLGGTPVACDVAIALGHVTATMTVAEQQGATILDADRVAAAVVHWRCVGEGETRVETRLRDTTAGAPCGLLIVQRPRG